MHIGFYSPALPASGETNGVVTYVRVMRDALTALGHTVTVATTELIESDGQVYEIRPPSRVNVLHEAVRRKDGSHPFVRARVLNAFKAAKRAGVDVFEMEETKGWAARLRGVPIVMRLHGPHFLVKDVPNADRIKAEDEAFRTVSAISSPTQQLLDEVLSRAALDTLARVIPNPIPLPDRKWHVSGADPDQILFVGRIDHVKGAELAIQSFARALQRRPSLKLLMVGPGDPVPAPPQVKFLGKLAPVAITELRLQSSLYVCASRFENFPYVIAEGMALGMPVLSTVTYGAQALIQDQITGRITNELAEAMIEMLSDRGRLAEMGAAARKSVANRLAPDLIARQSLALYRQVLVTANTRRGPVPSIRGAPSVHAASSRKLR